MQRNPIRSVLLFSGFAIWAFAFLAAISFNPLDPPSHAVFPYSAHVTNLCGTAGAYVAFWSRYAIGPGVYPILFFTAVFLCLTATKNRLSDFWLRVAGVGILAVAFAAIVHTLSGGTPSGLPEGDGGIMGIASAHFLHSHFNTVGSTLALLSIMLVGLILAADDLVLRAPGTLANALAAAKAKLPEPALMRFKFPDMPKLPTMPKFVTRDSGIARVTTDNVSADEDDEDFKPNPIVGRGRKVPPPPTDKPNLKYVPAPSDDDDIDLDFPADDYAMEDPHDLGPSEAAVIPERAPIPLPEVPEAELVHDSAVEIAPPAPAEVKRDILVRLPSMQKPKQMAPPPPKELGEYQLPGWDCLAEAEHGYAETQEAFVRAKAAELESTLKDFNIDAHVVEIDTGPVITMYELSLAAGIKVSTISGLSNDIQRALKAETVRIVAPIPGKNTVGIEVPNAEKEKVRLKDLMQLAPTDVMKDGGIPIFLGKDASGEPLIADLTKMPHCLIAGTTGSGKSVCINTIIMSIMYTQRPDMVKLILVDPKVVEMAPFRDIPHLMCPVITETAKACSVLEWACVKMDERYELLAEAGVRNIKDFNKMTHDELIERFNPGSPEEEARLPKKLPYMVVIIDELADLMMTSGKEVESFIVRIAQKARAVGIHLILATQRPQATVVTGLIKSNMPSKIAFRVASKMDSRIVLDMNGAELLLGHGDMLFLPNGGSKPMRGQGTYIDDKEIRESVKYVKTLAEAQYEPELIQIKVTGEVDDEAAKDPLFDDAVRVVLETKRGSVSLLQRRLTIGYSRASRLIEAMANAGIVGEYKGSQAREAAITIEEWDAIKAAQNADAADGVTE
ncbi:MAG: ftsK [Phycisphaerales bacterium]|nr:ftsK [Phycisphaerales bacterium]